MIPTSLVMILLILGPTEQIVWYNITTVNDVHATTGMNTAIIEPSLSACLADAKRFNIKRQNCITLRRD